MENRARIQVVIYAVIGYCLGHLLKQSARRSVPLQLVAGNIVLPGAQCADAGGVAFQVIKVSAAPRISWQSMAYQWLGGLQLSDALEVTQKVAVASNLQTQLLS